MLLIISICIFVRYKYKNEEYNLLPSFWKHFVTDTRLRDLVKREVNKLFFYSGLGHLSKLASRKRSELFYILVRMKWKLSILCKFKNFYKDPNDNSVNVTMKIQDDSEKVAKKSDQLKKFKIWEKYLHLIRNTTFWNMVLIFQKHSCV